MSKSKPVSRSGRFSSGPSAEVEAYGESVSFDYRLWEYDIMGSLVHARMLHHIGILNEEDFDAISAGLQEIGGEIEDGTFTWDVALEDVHMNIEAELTRRVQAGARLHAGRSRNDQIALDMRMWLRDQIADLNNELSALQESLLGLARANAHVIIPGYTHLQRAQPVSMAHHLLAYVEMFERDSGRLIDCFQRVNVCPLGSGAIAGSTLPLDREFVARELQFTDLQGEPVVSRNSMDAVSDRDYILEFCSASAILAMHFSRLSEDLILWSSSEFGFIRISDAYTTGSSLMPQKKNPDVCELARGKSGRVIGNLMGLLVVLKGLPMTYNRDLQEDKEKLFDTADTMLRTVRIFKAMVPEISVHEENCRRASADPLLLATDLADHLVLKGIPFRESHHIVGAVVALSEKLDKPLDQLSVEDLKSVDQRFDHGSLEVFKLSRSLESRTMTGAPSPSNIQRELTRWDGIIKNRTRPNPDFS